ncbi:putative Ion channel, partial [Globisporangium polare]
MNYLKVLPVEDEVKQIDLNETIVRHLSGAVGDALEPEVPDTDLVAPLKNDSLPDIIAIGDP